MRGGYLGAARRLAKPERCRILKYLSNSYLKEETQLALMPFAEGDRFEDRPVGEAYSASIRARSG